ncbi:MAG: TetR/AcrR family transcriptional regulator [Deltaproteobacteria bacterium]|nr:TetR/AcrR family transcriptional regulator [Deltaproteobacteria bacterium]
MLQKESLSKDRKKVPRSPDKHTRIINAALKVFAEKGFYNTRISEIAKEANVADGTIYLYFKNKDDILISLFEEKIGNVCKAMQEELNKTEDPVARMRIFAHNHLNMILRNRNLAEVIQVELRQSTKFMRQYVNTIFKEYLNLVKTIVRDGQNMGIFRQDVPPGIIKRSFFGALDEMARYWIFSTSKKYPPEDSAKHISDIFIQGLLVHPGKIREKSKK